jgi:peptide chain release factor 2
MEEIKKAVIKAIATLQIDVKSERITAIEEMKAKPDFWSDQQRAMQLSQEQSVLQQTVSKWLKLKETVEEIIDLEATDDPELLDELTAMKKSLELEYQQASIELSFSGEYDDHSAIIKISAGAGGTDAQDWAQMLMRMYLRWAEKSKVKSEITDQSNGDEAGIKSVTILLTAQPYLYGKLKHENGVHRLVRLSPFNSDSLRQTSFAKVEVMPLVDKDTEIEIDDKELKIDVYRAGGHGGQSVNTTDSAVRITHISTGVTVAIQNERSQLQNRATAMTIIRSKLAKLKEEQHTEKLSQLKGPNEQAAWGNQIRNYVLHPYKMVKDLRSGFESTAPDEILSGEIDTLLSTLVSSVE